MNPPILPTIEPTSVYWQAFKMLYEDFEESFRYVHPADSQLSVYSSRYYELLLRACTEFESLCKDKVMELSLSNKTPDKLNVTDYWLLAKPLDLVEYSVGFNFHPLYKCQPLSAWANTHRLVWYQEYNEVKHNRVTHFSKANLKNVTDAIAGFLY